MSYIPSSYSASSLLQTDYYKRQKKYNMEHEKVESCVDSIVEQVNTKIINKNHIINTVKQKTLSQYTQLEKIKEDIESNQKKQNAWNDIQQDIMGLFRATRNFDSSLLEESNENFLDAKTYKSDDSKDIIVSNVRNDAMLGDIKIQVKQIAKAHTIISNPFYDDVINNSGINDIDKFSPGIFRIGIQNYPRFTEKFAALNIDITDTGLPNYFNIGYFTITTENQRTKRIDIIKGDTLETLEKKIQDSQLLVSTKIIKDGGDYRLIIISKQPGVKYFIYDHDKILNNQFALDEMGAIYKDLVSVKIQKKDTLGAIKDSINEHKMNTGVVAHSMRVNSQGNEALVLTTQYTGAGSIINISDPNSCLNGVFRRSFDMPNHVSSAVQFDLADAPIVSAFHDDVNIFTEGKVMINDIMIKLEKNDTLNIIVDKINAFSALHKVTAQATQDANNKFILTLDSTNNIRIIDFYRSLNDVFDNNVDITVNDATTISKPQDAVIIANNIEILQNSNRVLNLFGIDIDLIAPTQQISSIKVMPDIDLILKHIDDFISQYNALLKTINKHNHYSDESPDNQAGILQGNSVVSQILGDLDISNKNTKLLEECGIHTFDVKSHKNDKGEVEPGCKNCLRFDESKLRTTIYQDIEKIKKAFTFVLETSSQNFLAPFYDQKKIVNFGQLEVKSIDIKLNLGKKRFISSTSKSFDSMDSEVTNKTGSIFINDKEISIEQGTSLLGLEKIINQVFYYSKANDRIEAGIIKNGMGQYSLHLKMHKDNTLSIIDNDKILNNLFSAQSDTLESTPFANKNDIAVQDPSAPNQDPNLLSSGSFKINGYNIELLAGETWRDVYKKIKQHQIPNVKTKIMKTVLGEFSLQSKSLTPGDRIVISDSLDVINSAFNFQSVTLDNLVSKKFSDPSAVAVSKSRLRPGRFFINQHPIDIAVGDTWGVVLVKLRNALQQENIKVTIQKALKTKSSFLVLQSTTQELRINVTDDNNVLNQVFTLNSKPNTRLFFDTTNVAKAVIHSKDQDIKRKLLYKIYDQTSDILEQSAIIEPFNSQSYQDRIDFRLIYYNGNKKYKDSANIKISQGFVDILSIKMKPYTNDALQLGAVQSQITDLQAASSELVKKQIEIQKECDSICKKITVAIKQEENKRQLAQSIIDSRKKMFDEL